MVHADEIMQLFGRRVYDVVFLFERKYPLLKMLFGKVYKHGLFLYQTRISFIATIKHVRRGVSKGTVLRRGFHYNGNVFLVVERDEKRK